MANTRGPASILASDPALNGGRRVMLVAGNDADANTTVAALVAALGFAPITLGTIAEGGSLLRFCGPRVLQNLLQY
jgi:predicted dinucleotide-binding enzyme